MSMKWIPTILVVGLAITLPGHASAQDDPLGFFITSVGPGNGGDLGGLDGADAYCKELAEAEGAGDRTWRAYLSTQASGGQPAVNARDRIGEGPWFNAEGLSIAADVDDLHYSNANINYDHALNERGERVNSGANGDSPSMHDILTGTQLDGTAFPPGRIGPVTTGRAVEKEARWWDTTTGSPSRLLARRGTSPILAEAAPQSSW